MVKKSLSLLLAALLLLTLVLSVPGASAEGLPFSDVREGKWYYEAVKWAYENGYVSGTSEDTFSPNKECTRAEFVMILWVIAGRPEPTIENPFTDVREGKWYYKAVLWAKETGITDGKTPDSFAPNDYCTRAEAVTFIWNYFGKPVVDPEVQFSDVKIGKWYYNSVNWAFSNGVTSGTSPTTFSPHINVTRAMVVTFLFRMKHVLEGGQHEFELIEVLPETCTQGASKIYGCVCGNTKTIYEGDPLGHDYVESVVEPSCAESGYTAHICSRCGDAWYDNYVAALGHDFCKAKLISDATANSPTVYQLVCARCGEHDGNGDRSLGKPIFGPPEFNTDYATHHWTEDELINGIQFSSDNGATATIRRKWFANAWCYIAEMVLPEGAYSQFTGTNIVNMFGSNNESNRISAYNLMRNTNQVNEAQILFNGDTQLYNYKQTMRAGQVYLGKNPNENAGWDVTFWNPTNGSYGAVRDLLPSIRDTKFSTLKALGITDVFCFRIATIKYGRMDMTEFYSEADYDEDSYKIYQLGPNGIKARRQCTMMGFKKEGSTVHIFFVVADGNSVTNHDATTPNHWSNDFASYGNTKREMMILLSTLGAEYAMNMDGGHSAAMIIRRNGQVEQINATDRNVTVIDNVTYSEVPARELWDFLYFK